MARNFSVRTVLRQVSNQQLKEFFQRQGIPDRSIEWELLGEYQIDSLYEAIQQLDNKSNANVESALRDIFDLACPEGNQALREIAASDDIPQFADDYPVDFDLYNASIWAWLHYSELIPAALQVHLMDTTRWWRKRDDLPRMGFPLASCRRGTEANQMDAEKCEQAVAERVVHDLKTKICVILQRDHGRARQCSIERLTRGKIEYFIIYADDYVEQVSEHDDNGHLKPNRLRKTFEIVFAFNRTEGSLELASSLPLKTKVKLEQAFASAVFNFDLPVWDKKPAYRLDHLWHSPFAPVTDPEDQIEVAIKKLRLDVQNSKRRVVLEADTNDDPLDIFKMKTQYLPATELQAENAKVGSVTFHFRVMAREGRRGGAMTFEVISPDRCSLRGLRPEQAELALKYLKKWGILDESGPATHLASTGNGTAPVRS